MSAEGALVQELKRLVLENEKLKAMLVFADKERELMPIPRFGGGFVLHPLTASVDCSMFDMNGRESHQTIRRQCGLALVDALMKTPEAGPFAGFVKDSGAADARAFGLRLVSSAYVGIPKR